MKLLRLSIILVLINAYDSFIPAKLLNQVISKLDSISSTFNPGKVSDSYVHEEILKLAVTKSESGSKNHLTNDFSFIT